MASTIDTIEALFVTHLDAVTGLDAAVGPPREESLGTFAWTRTEAGGGDWEFSMGSNSHTIRPYTLEILVTGNDRGNVSTALQTIQTLWFGTTNRSAISAAGVLEMLPSNIEEPFCYDGDMAMGSVSFEFRVAYTV